ncbi:MAG: shikimate dehydrogenase [Candidatus Falkowbacteria bacterium]|nr:shikimate dehydrogenase [Candidatus Falkowbacteria bacterium]
MQYSALIGDPVEHSVSPTLFYLLADYARIEYSHLKIRVKSKRDLKNTLYQLRFLGFCGVNVTLPYKLDIIRCLDVISPSAAKIGAVNTVVFRNHTIVGYNTDAIGALRAIETKLKKLNKNDKVLILGAGGAARAIVYALYSKTRNIVILNKNIGEAKKLSLDVSGGKIQVENLSVKNISVYFKDSNIIVNATPVGMHPNNKQEIVSKDIFVKNSARGKYFFDAIFNPYKTNFLINAEKRGGKVCSGMYMMIFQGIEAFKLWTGVSLKNVNVERINRELINKIA